MLRRYASRSVLVYPMMALIHLFIYILEYPALLTVDTDTSLMHEAAGHFDFLEYTTGIISPPFIRKLATLARLAVTRQRESRAMTSPGINYFPKDLPIMAEISGTVLALVSHNSPSFLLIPYFGLTGLKAGSLRFGTVREC